MITGRYRFCMLRKKRFIIEFISQKSSLDLGPNVESIDIESIQCLVRNPESTTYSIEGTSISTDSL